MARRSIARKLICQVGRSWTVRNSVRNLLISVAIAIFRQSNHSIHQTVTIAYILKKWCDEDIVAIDLCRDFSPFPHLVCQNDKKIYARNSCDILVTSLFMILVQNQMDDRRKLAIQIGQRDLDLGIFRFPVKCGIFMSWWQVLSSTQILKIFKTFKKDFAYFQ